MQMSRTNEERSQSDPLSFQPISRRPPDCLAAWHFAAIGEGRVSPLICGAGGELESRGHFVKQRSAELKLFCYLLLLGLGT